MEAIRQWAKGAAINVVLWTDLPGSSDDVPADEFLNAAVHHAQQLSPEGKLKAAEYVWRAPDFIQTQLRKVLQAQPWFRKPQ